MKVLDYLPGHRTVRSAAIIVLAAAGLMSCTTYQQPPQQVRTTAPTVTYAYQTDERLVEATRKAEEYCMKYNSWPRVSTVNPNTAGGRDAVFTCDRPRTAVYEPLRPIPARPMVSYTYRDDRDLVEATQSAERYCAGFRTHAVSSTVVTNGDGSRTVNFQCS